MRLARNSADADFVRADLLVPGLRNATAGLPGVFLGRSVDGRAGLGDHTVSLEIVRRSQRQDDCDGGHMRPGDHICVDRGSYWDHGIYISQEQVIHFSVGPLGDSNNFVICNTTLDEFAPGGWNSCVGVVDYRGHPHFSYPEVIERAKSQLGKHCYNLKDRNCEHFAKWCANGESDSHQAEEAQGLTVVEAAGPEGPTRLYDAGLLTDDDFAAAPWPSLDSGQK